MTNLTQTFARFVRSEQAGGLLLIGATVIALACTNSALGPAYIGFWERYVGGLSIAHWVNDALMAVFFLLIGLELERELYVGELSEPRKALLPAVAAAGGMLFPALLHFVLNSGTPTQAGIGIPMATDIAFALGVLALLGRRVPPALKVFLVAFAVIDDLGAIVIIAVFYTATFSLAWFAAALGVWLALAALNRVWRVMGLWPYLIGGALLWFCMLRSGVHATIAGVLLAFVIPFASRDGRPSPSHRLEHALHRPVAFFILPVFALANAGIVIGADWAGDLTNRNALGIGLGLLLGKPVGVTLLCALATALGLCRLPEGVGWRHVWGAGLLGGIGFTMSIFITQLAFAADPAAINASKMAILLASLLAGTFGFAWLRLIRQNAGT